MGKYNCKPLLTIRSSSFVISRGGTKAHFAGKIPEGYNDELMCTNDKQNRKYNHQT